MFEIFQRPHEPKVETMDQDAASAVDDLGSGHAEFTLTELADAFPKGSKAQRNQLRSQAAAAHIASLEANTPTIIL